MGIEVYDNGGKTADRYIVVIRHAVIGMSSNPLSPDGINQFYCERSELRRDGLGKRIPITELPEEVRKAILERVREI